MYKKKIPEHIYAKWDDQHLQWGVWNERLQQWVGEDEYFGHAVFGSKQEAEQWFYDRF